MSSKENIVKSTQHAFLVAWGWFAEHIRLPEQIEAVSLKQKHYHHRPQTKVLEFLVSILAGSKYLQDISLAAHPLDKDQAVAEAWGQPGWADYSGVSRTLTSLSWEEARQLAQVLEDISKDFIDKELHLLRTGVTPVKWTVRRLVNLIAVDKPTRSEAVRDSREPSGVDADCTIPR